MKNRLANIELLRGLLMFYVVGCHVINLGANFCPPLLTAGDSNYVVSTLYDSFFMVAVDCFVIISGYFGIKLKVKKIVALMLPVYFYSIGIGVISKMFGGDISLSNFLPILRNSYWFLTSYILLCLFSPFLNDYVEEHNSKEILRLLIVLYVLFSVIPSFSFFSLTHDDGFGIVNFMLMYLTGRYISKENEKFVKPWYFWLIIHFFVVAFICFENIFAGYVFNYNEGYQGLFWHYDNIFIILGSVTLFLSFSNLKVGECKIANVVCWLSSSFFYIYIIHCTRPLQAVFFDIVDSPSFLNAPLFPLYALLLTIIIYAGCLVTDIVVRRIMLRTVFLYSEQFISKLISKSLNVITKK